MIRYAKRFFIVCITVLFASVAFAQQESGEIKSEDKPAGKVILKGEKDPSQEYSEADRPEENYLARFHALERVELLMKRNLDRIFTLNVIVKNFKSQNPEWENDYKKVYDQYKEGVDLFYRRNVIYSRVKLEANHVAINDLYKKISLKYREDALTLLNLCADNILELMLDANTSSDPNKNRILFNNKNRIRVAYGQMDDAERAALDRTYYNAVRHYRVAKVYAIKILETLNPEQYKGKYDVHKADNRNRILTSKKTTAPAAEVEVQ